MRNGDITINALLQLFVCLFLLCFTVMNIFVVGGGIHLFVYLNPSSLVYCECIRNVIFLVDLSHGHLLG